MQTCDNVRGSKCHAIDCFGTYITHVQSCDIVRAQSSMQWTASVHTLHMSKPVRRFVSKVPRNGLLRYMHYTRPKPVITFVFKSRLRNGLLRYMHYTHVQTCDNVLVQSAMQWTASVHTLHMSKPVIMFVFKVLRNGLLRYIHCTCPNLS